MYLVHVLFRSTLPAPGSPPLGRSPGRAEALDALGVAHVTEHEGEEPGTAVLTLFVRAATLGQAEERARTACLVLGRAPWRPERTWPGMVTAYYEKLLAGEET
ncbi:hypothetical protein AB0E83_31290 [Streptomyces sp. NPDC035033]|uniref:hypothetical protein n=1 Tax=Streptomyces sp. NPDC035033 TaxID=3155368 RepID=UPI0033D478CD